MRSLLTLLALATPLLGQGKRIDLGFPDLKERIQVVLPENYDPSRTWPAIFYYHGTGGSPTTELIRAHTDNEDWIVVGMSYTQTGNIPATPEYIDKERKYLDSTRKHLRGKYNLDHRRVYVAGFSKGGWMADYLLQRDATLAGGIILGAGHFHALQKRPLKFRQTKPIFLGIGRLDENYPFALRAVVRYRPLRGVTTLDTWHGTGHQFPRDGSASLRQWLKLQAHPKINHKAEAQQWLTQELESIKGIANPVGQWRSLRSLESTAFLRLLGEEGKAKVVQERASLEQSPRVAAEAKALAAHRSVLRKELKPHTRELLRALAAAYLKVGESHRGTEQSEIALHDFARITKLIKHFNEQENLRAEAKKKKEKKKKNPEERDPFDRSPKPTPRIPLNPLIR